MAANEMDDGAWYMQLNETEWSNFDWEMDQRVKRLSKDEIPLIEQRAKAGNVVAQTTLGIAYREGVDRIVEKVSSLLDMHPLKLHFTISLYKTQAEVSAAYRALGMLGAAPVAFYSHRSRTIAVSIDDITDRILAHEIAHAVICAYFVTPPPTIMQEILAQHVDKNLWD